MLGIPELIIEEVLGSHGAAAPSTDESVLTERAASIEDSLADKITDAVSTLHELTIGAESEAVRAISAQRILEYATGGLRPKKSQQPAVHVTVDTMNILIQKAAEQYQKMLSEVPKQAEVFSAQLN
jgi:hypothetical protein